MKFSLVIPLAPERTPEILDSIKELDYPKSEFHVVVVKGLNPSDNRNKGVEKAKGDIIVFLDDDALMEKNYLKEAEKFLNEHPEIDIVGGPQLSPKNEEGFAKISGYGLSSKFGAWSVSHRYIARKESLDVDETAITSANLLCKKHVLEKVKFDTKLFPGEDPKFIEDAKNIGFRVAYTPGLIVYHKRRPTLGLFMKQMFNYGKVRPFKESFSSTLKRPFFLAPSAFIIYLLFLLSISMYNPNITGDAINSYSQLNLKNLNFSTIIFLPLFLYVLISLLFSLHDASKNNNFKAVLFMPFIYLLIHVCYGTGMIWGYAKKNFTNKSVG